MSARSPQANFESSETHYQEAGSSLKDRPASKMVSKRMDSKKKNKSDIPCREPDFVKNSSPPSQNYISNYKHKKPWQRALIALTVIGVLTCAFFAIKASLKAANIRQYPSTKQIKILSPKDLKNSDHHDYGDEDLFSSGIQETKRLMTPSSPLTDLFPIKNDFSNKLATPVLESFLNATSIAERLPIIETSLNHEQLEKSVLNKPFPPRKNVYLNIQSSYPADHSSDCYYNLDFFPNEQFPARQIILVRIRDGLAKIVVDPFLDSFGGRLEAYATKVQPSPEHFQVLAVAIAGCYDKTVPNYQNKLTMRFLPRDREKEIAKAYFDRRSKIGDWLEDPDSEIQYGEARTCTVTLQWNTTEDPKNPYLEAIEITGFRWNP